MNNGDLFGNTVTCVTVIQFEIEWIALCAMYVFLDRLSRLILKYPDNMCSIISTDIPGDRDHELQNIILKHNFHTHCGDVNPDAVCTQQAHKPSGERTNTNNNDTQPDTATITADNIFRVFCILEQLSGLQHEYHDFKKMCSMPGQCSSVMCQCIQR